MSTASTSSRHSTIARKYERNATRGLTGTRQKGIAALRLPKAAPVTPAKKTPAPPQQPGRQAQLVALGLNIVTVKDPAWVRSFLLRGSDVVLCGGGQPTTKEARRALRSLIDNHLAKERFMQGPRPCLRDGTG